MHNIFHLTFALAAAALTSSPVAVIGLQLEPRLRGPVLVAVSDQDDTDRGYSDGQQQATYFWTSKFNSDCNSISSYDAKIENYISKKYSNCNSCGQSSTQYFYYQGAKNGMRAQQQVYDDQCMNNRNTDYVDVQDCSAIGVDTASIIAQTYARQNTQLCGWGNNNNEYTLPPYNQYGNIQECITIANDDCVGNMDVKIKMYCNSQYTNYQTLSTLKMKCLDQVTSTINRNN